MKPEVYGALSLAYRHERTADRWRWQRHPRRDARQRHLDKARKLRARAERLSA